MTIDYEFGFEIEDKLEDALAMLAAGIPLEEVLAEAGDDARWLRPMLELANEVGELRQSVSIPGPEASLRKMLFQAEMLGGTAPRQPSTQPAWSYLLSNIFGGGFRLAAGLATALLVFLLAGGTFTLAAQRSLPGEPLYRFKRAAETLQLNLARDPGQREQLRDTFNQRRQMEVNRLLAQGQEAQVTLQGRVDTVTIDTIELAGLTARVTSDTQINGQLAAGVRVQAEIRVQPPDRLTAISIIVVESPPSIPLTPTPTPTATATPAKARATDTLPTLEPTVPPVRLQEFDTLPTPTSTPTAIPTEDTDFEDMTPGDDSTDAANENDNGDDSITEDNANFDDNDNFDADDFEDGDVVLPDDGDSANDNSGDDGDNKPGDNSGSDDFREDNSGKGNSDDRDGDDHSSNEEEEEDNSNHD